MWPQLPVHGRREAAFSLLWILANAVGGAVGGTFIDGNWLVGTALFVLSGGILEWLVLRPYLRIPVWWIPATGVGGSSRGPPSRFMAWSRQSSSC